jgi:uncharacterized protein (DUF1800 family)
MPVNPDAPLTDAHRRHLLRRAGFGPSDKEMRSLLRVDTRGEAADALLKFPAKAFRPGGKDFDRMHNKWFKFMLKTKYPLHSKLVLFWHDHFATGFSKVNDTKLMGEHIRVLHTHAKGNFSTFLKEMSRNAAMMEWLDTVRNSKRIPNENYARELKELFTLGVNDLAPTPQPNYTQDDIVQVARAFTGWRYDDRSHEAYLSEWQHDYKDQFNGDGDPPGDTVDRGPKVIFKTTGQFGPQGRAFDDQGEGPQEIDRVIDIILEHRDSQGKNTVARRTAYRLCQYLAHDSPSVTGFVDQVVNDSGFDTSWDIAALVRSILCHDDFYLTAPANYTASGKKSVKWPIDFTVSTLRLLRVRPVGKYFQITGGSYHSMLTHLTNMGQVIADPPSVFGWDWESGWVSSAAMLARYNFARDLGSSRDGGGAFRPEKLMDIGLTDPGDIVDAAVAVLGLQDHLTSADRTVLINYLTNNGTKPTLDLTDDDTRYIKLHGLFALLVQSPAYQLH